MPFQLPTLAGQATGLQTCRLRGVEFLHDVGQKQNVLRFDANRLLNVGVRLRLTLGPRRGIEIPAEQRRQIPASEQPKISFCAWIEPDEYTNS